MSTYKVTGGIPLSGTIVPVPNKNSILPIICACILTDEVITLHNVPKSASVRVMLQIYRKLGGTVSYLKGDKLKLNGNKLKGYRIDKELAKKERASMMFLGPLLARFKKAEIADAGGCKLGNRPIDTLYQGLVSLGAKFDETNFYNLYTDGLNGNDDIWLMEASVTGTENLIIAAVLAKGKTVINNAACEPHVQDLCNFLNSIGASISGIGSNRLTIEGVNKLSGGEWSIISDHLDVGGLMVAAALTGGEITIKDAIPEHMQPILNNLEKLNVQYKIKGKDIFVPSKQELVCKTNMKGDIDIIRAEPWPGFPADLLPQALVLALKAKGSMRIMNYMYESQLLFTEDLRKFGAKFIIADPHRVVTFGPSVFKAAVTSAADIIQAAHAEVLVALAAEGESQILNADAIARRYPDLLETLIRLGARIEKLR